MPNVQRIGRIVRYLSAVMLSLLLPVLSLALGVPLLFVAILGFAGGLADVEYGLKLRLGFLALLAATTVLTSTVFWFRYLYRHGLPELDGKEQSA